MKCIDGWGQKWATTDLSESIRDRERDRETGREREAVKAACVGEQHVMNFYEKNQ